MLATDWALLPYFLAVARAGNLRAGADLLNASHVTTRRNIDALEASYKTRLFIRSRRGFELTQAGKDLLPLAEEAERTFVKARNRVEGREKGESGTIRFSAPPILATELLAPIVTRFTDAYPDIRIEWDLSSAIADINRAEADVSLRAAEHVSGDVVARKLYRFSTATFASRRYIEDNIAKAGPEGEGLCWLGWHRFDAQGDWAPPAAHARAQVRQMSQDGVMNLSLLKNGAGMSRFPVIFGTLHPDLMRVPNTEIEAGATLWIVLHSELRRTVYVRRFVDFLVRELTALKPQMIGAAEN